eukprot:15456938-Heterocapsa_arctica.AAC.1
MPVLAAAGSRSLSRSLFCRAQASPRSSCLRQQPRSPRSRALPSGWRPELPRRVSGPPGSPKAPAGQGLKP